MKNHFKAELNIRFDNVAILKTDCMCSVCGGYEFYPQKLIRLLRCNKCGLIVSQRFWETGANLELEKEWFEEEYLESLSWWTSLFESLNNRRTWSRISPYIKRNCRLLEIGVGSGSFLVYARKRGLYVHGCDLSASICQHLRQRYNISMCTSISDLSADTKYDIVVMNHVLEHVNNPIDFLQGVQYRMSDNGLLHLIVPNVACWEAALRGWVSYEPYHLIYFTESTIRKVVTKAGFKVIKVTTSESFSGWFLSILRTLLKTNATSPEQRQFKRYLRMSSWIEHAYRTLMVVIGLAIIPLRYVQARLGYGDEIIVLAQPNNREEESLECNPI